MANRKFTSRYNIKNFEQIIGQKCMSFSLNYAWKGTFSLMPKREITQVNIILAI